MTIGDNRHSLLSEYIGYSDDLVHRKLDEFILEPRARADRMEQALRRNIGQLNLQENGDLDQLTRQIGLSEKEMAQKYQQSRTLKALPQKLTQLRRSSLNAEQDPALRGEFALQVIQFYEDSRKAINLHFGINVDDKWREYYMEHLTGLPRKLSTEEAFQKHFNAVKGLVDFITWS